jgi:hypothetical protein
MNLKWCIEHRLTHPVRKKSFGLVKPSKYKIQIQQKLCDPATELISIFPSFYFYSYMNSFGIHCFNELKMVCIEHRLTHPVRKKSFRLVKPFK